MLREHSPSPLREFRGARLPRDLRSALYAQRLDSTNIGQQRGGTGESARSVRPAAQAGTTTDP